MLKNNIAPNTAIKLLDNLNRDFDAHLSTEFLDNANSIVLVIIPQVHLAPYVHALLLKKGYLFTRNIIVIQQLSYKMASDLFIQWPNILQLDIKFAHSVEKPYFAELTRRLSLRSALVAGVVLHNFAENINQYVAEHCLDRLHNKAFFDHTEICFYADGSRNNAKPEITGQVVNGFHALASATSIISRLYYFGFIHGRATPSESNFEVIPYSYLEATLANLNPFSKIKDPVAPNKTECAVVLTRYWGRAPYFFDEKIDLLDIFIESIQPVLPVSTPLIIRNDARFNISLNDLLSKLTNKGFQVSLFENLFDVFGTKAEALLFENFLIDNPVLLSRITYIYCFDSCFSLIFQNKDLYNFLPSKVRLYLGFNRLSVQKHGLDECYAVMRQRTVETISSLCKLSLFNIFDSGGLVYSPSIHQDLLSDDIFERFDKGDGYFILEKA